MHTTDSPSVGRATGLIPSPRQNQNLNTEQLADLGLTGNIRRRLIHAQSGADAWEVFTLSVHYEVHTSDQQWIFAEKWEAILQQVKIAQSLGAKERTP